MEQKFNLVPFEKEEKEKFEKALEEVCAEYQAVLRPIPLLDENKGTIHGGIQIFKKVLVEEKSEPIPSPFIENGESTDTTGTPKTEA